VDVRDGGLGGRVAVDVAVEVAVGVPRAVLWGRSARWRVEGIGREAGDAGIVVAASGRWKAAAAFAEEGSGGAVGEFAIVLGFAEGAAVGCEELDGVVAGVGADVGGAAAGESVGGVEEIGDAGLVAPDDELAEGEFVCRGDFEEGAVGFEEVGEEEVWVNGFVVDLGVDGGLERGMGGGGEHGENVPRFGVEARGQIWVRVT